MLNAQYVHQHARREIVDQAKERFLENRRIAMREVAYMFGISTF
jgi:hypothetical protein